MGGFLGIGGSSAKTDRGNELAGFGDLKNLFSTGLSSFTSGAATGGATTGAGVGTMGNALSYWKNILSGNRAAMAQAVAPETNQALATSDAAKRQSSAMGTARGGGTGAANQTRESDTLATVNNMLFGARPAAAAGTAQVGGELARTGTTETALANQQLGIAGEAASNLTKDAGQARVDDYKINQDMVGKWSQAIMNIMGAFA